MGFEFKVKLSAVMALINGAAAGLSYIASQGNITVTIVCTAISIGITQGISYYNEQVLAFCARAQEMQKQILELVGKKGKESKLTV